MGAATEHARDLETLHALLERIPTPDCWCVEIGAWDGTFLSSSRDLIIDHGYRAALIEANPERFAQLDALYAGRDDVFPLNRVGGWSGDERLDAILASTPVPRTFDLLVIDVDGNDYHLWDALQEYRPKVVMIEFNSTIPTEVDFVQPPDHRLNWSSGIGPIERLGHAKGYVLAACSDYNAFFVAEEVAAKAGIEGRSSRDLRDHRPTFLFLGMDGTVFVDGLHRLPHHDIAFSERRLQQLPALLRRHPDAYGRITWRLLNLLRWWRNRNAAHAHAGECGSYTGSTSASSERGL